MAKRKPRKSSSTAEVNSQAASHIPPTTEHTQQTQLQTPKQTNTPQAHKDEGDSPAAVAVGVLDGPELPAAHAREGESRAKCWERIRKESRAAGLGRLEAYNRANEETERLFPPEPPPVETPAETPPVAEKAQIAPNTPDRGVNEGRVQGLGEIPTTWPTLADNAGQQAELSWVQANRLRVVEETASGAVRVHLDRASAPAPSWAALSWLETSIRSYAKYVDIVARSLSVAQDEQELVRRERLALEEIDALLAEMRQR